MFEKVLDPCANLGTIDSFQMIKISTIDIISPRLVYNAYMWLPQFYMESLWKYDNGQK